MSGVDDWTGYFLHLLWRRAESEPHIEAEVVGGPEDGKVWALRRGTREVVMVAPVEPLVAMLRADGQQYPTETLTTRQVIVPVRRRLTVLIDDPGSDWHVGVLEWILLWPRGSA